MRTAAPLRDDARMSDERWIVPFEEGGRDMRELLGGKGAGVAEMTRVLGAERVPAGFTITTEACVAYLDASRAHRARRAAAAALRAWRSRPAAGWGTRGDPLLVSVRSGARESMPGMIDTVLNLGFNDVSVAGLAERHRQRALRLGFLPAPDADVRHRGAAGCRRDASSPRSRRQGASGRDAGRRSSTRRRCARSLGDFQALYAATEDSRRTRARSCAKRSVRCSTPGSVSGPWPIGASITSRTTGARPCTVQRMVFGNTGGASGSGVAFCRDEITGAPQPSGDFLVNAQGEDVVSGVRTPRDLSELAERLPDAHAELLEILRTLEAHYGDMQDAEFTVEDGRLFLLQTRVAKRPAQAAVRFAVDAVGEGLLDQRAGARDDRPLRARRVAAPALRPRTPPRSPAASPPRRARPRAQLVFTAADAVAWAERGEHVILARPFTEADDVHGFYAAQGILTAEGGKASHAALVARGMGTPCVAGASALRIDLEARELRVGGGLREGDLIAIDGGDRPRDRRGRAARPSRSRPELRPGPRLDRRAAPAGRARQRRHPGGRAQGARVRRGGHRPVPHRAHVHGRGPPAHGAGDDHGRGRPSDRRVALEELLPLQRRTSRTCSRRWPTCRLRSACSIRRCTSSSRTPGSSRSSSSGRDRAPRRRAAARAHARPRARARGDQPDARHPRRRLGIVAPEIYDIQVEAIIAAARAVPTPGDAR